MTIPVLLKASREDPLYHPVRCQAGSGMSGANSGYKTVFEGLYDESKVLKLVRVVVAGFLFPKVRAHPRFTANGKKSLRS